MTDSTALTPLEVHFVGCGQHIHNCTCQEPANHSTNHKCRCGSEWKGKKGSPDYQLISHSSNSCAPHVLDPDRPVGDGPEIIYLPTFKSATEQEIDDAFKEMMEILFSDSPMFRVPYLYGRPFKIETKSVGPTVEITVEVDEPDYGRLIQQCEPPQALQSGEVRSDRRD